MAASTAVSLGWVHCNKCYELLVNKRRRLFLMECQHIGCEDCVQLQPATASQGAPKYTCATCSKVVQAHEIKNDMPQSMRQLFHPNPLSVDYMTPGRIVRFQMKHRQHYDEYIQKLPSMMKKMEESYEEHRKTAKKLAKDLNCMSNECASLERKVRVAMKEHNELKEQERKRREEAMRRPMPPESLSSINDSLLNFRVEHVRPPSRGEKRPSKPASLPSELKARRMSQARQFDTGIDLRTGPTFPSRGETANPQGFSMMDSSASFLL